MPTRRPSKWLPLRALVVVGVVAAIVGLAPAPSRASTTVSYDAAADFSSTANPSGAWSYGWSQSRGSGFVLLPTPTTIGGGSIDVWTGSSSTNTLEPLVFDNPSSATVNPSGTNPIPPHTLNFHPGPEGQNAIIRWSAPSAGTYDVRATFTGRDDVGGTTTDVAVLNDGLELFGGEVTGYLSTQSYSGTITAQAGDTIDFTVGDGTDGNYLYDSTGLDAAIVRRADTTAPSVSCSSPDGAWHGSDVSIACTASDSDSGLANQAQANFALATNVSAGVETADASTNAVQVCDNAGNCATAGPVDGIKIDKKQPAVTCGPTPRFLLDQVNAGVSAVVTDSGSGPDTATVSTVVDTSSTGPNTIELTGYDDVGNSASIACPYQVDYAFGGFLSPVKAPSTINTGKAGRTYAIKWQLADANGAPVSSLAAIRQITIEATACTDFAIDPVNALVATAAGNTILRYDATGNQYVYNWATPAAGCYTLFLELDSGQILPAFFHLS